MPSKRKRCARCALQRHSSAHQTLESHRLDAKDNRPYANLMRFECDPRKTATNLSARKVRFPEAASGLQDDNAMMCEDPDAVGEQRFSRKKTHPADDQQ